MGPEATLASLAAPSCSDASTANKAHPHSPLTTLTVLYRVHSPAGALILHALELSMIPGAPIHPLQSEANPRGTCHPQATSKVAPGSAVRMR